MLTARARSEAQTLSLPGRTWALLIGPEVAPTERLTMGYAHFPAGSSPEGHTHPTQDEVIYVVAGSGYLRSSDQEIRLEPGTAVLIGPGTEHATVADTDSALELVTIFSPPVVPGAYETAPSS
jgi:quercetin dioxygenase-like cupin family protein